MYKRDYMAGEVSKDITRRFLLDGDIVEAHERGIIHFHDADYFAQHMHNCCLVNLEDMPRTAQWSVRRWSTVQRAFYCMQYCNTGNRTDCKAPSMADRVFHSHLAPFVDVSRQSSARLFARNWQLLYIEPTEEMVTRSLRCVSRKRSIAESRWSSIRWSRFMTTNGQAPFVTVFMYLDEVPKDSFVMTFAKSDRGSITSENPGCQEWKRCIYHTGVPETHLCIRGRQYPRGKPLLVSDQTCGKESVLQREWYWIISLRRSWKTQTGQLLYLYGMPLFLDRI